MEDLDLALMVVRVELLGAAMWVKMNSNLGFEWKDIPYKGDSRLGTGIPDKICNPDEEEKR